ncbi:hypothetical protein ACIRQH_37920 [Streptomyces sp. NPDC102279]|uniref:hypothetical protein n=1 Tax=Streptomyces sp. NPDC102279 TaxID=3366153 RepID=UPI003825C84E
MTDLHQVFVNEGTFGLLVDGMIPVETADWSNGLVAPMSQGALILTGINTGYVEASVTAQESAPVGAPAESWDEIVEVSIRTQGGNLKLESLDLGPVTDAALPLPPSASGWYRLRVHACGRELLYDKTSMEPVEKYLLTVWPGSETGSTVVRSSERIERASQTQWTPPAREPAPAVDHNPPVRKAF